MNGWGGLAGCDAVQSTMAAWLVHHMAFACCLAGGRRCHSPVCEPSMAGAVRGECGMINSTNDASQTTVLTLHDVHKSFGEAHIIRGVEDRKSTRLNSSQ